jgi:FtsP/CotA-like multicopper oxidase with cupredoxin domain
MTSARLHPTAPIAALLIALLSLPSAHAAQPTGPGTLRPAQDLNPDPRILEVNFTVSQTDVDLTGTGLKAHAYTYNGTIPGPELRAKVGDTVIVHVENRLPEPTLIHWHGIELDNPNDGTTVTQNQILPGDKFTYRFRVPRPGIFWYHPHAMPTNQLFRGMYGPLIVEDPDAAKLIGLGVLPDASRTRTLMLSDTTVCKASGQNDAVTYPGGAQVSWVFTQAYGAFPGHTESPTPRDLCEKPLGHDGLPAANAGPLSAGDIPNIQTSPTCGTPQLPCRVNEGQLVLANGRVPAARPGTPEKPGPLAKNADVITARADEGIRLRLLNAAGIRYFRLRLTDQQGQDVPIYRIGGQGGLLDQVRLEGGQIGTVELRYAKGELVLAPAERADVVVVARGKPGDVMTLWTQDYQHYGTAAYPFGYGALPTLPVAHIRIASGKPAGKAFRIAAGDPLRTHAAVKHPTASIRNEALHGQLVDPATLSPPQPGSKNPLMLLAVVGLRETIDGVNGASLEGPMDGRGDFREIPHVDSTRYARVGDTLEMVVRNGTQMHHPWHLHGFSFQPIRLEDSLGNVVYQYEHNEFVDTWNVPGTHRLVFRVHLEDRGAVDGPADGGAIGRWMMHCHIFHHNGVGMMSELVVLPREAKAEPVAGR